MKKISRNGFTIIEVSLVLAIAGLIFLMVFVALPGLRASQRDTDRRESIIEFLDKVKSYQRNNRGALPGTSDNTSGSLEITWDSIKNTSAGAASWAGFYKDYLGENFMDADGVNFKLEVFDCDASEVDADCNNSLLSSLDGGFPNDYRLMVVLQATCRGPKAIRTKNPRKLAVLYRLESAGVYCNNT